MRFKTKVAIFSALLFAGSVPAFAQIRIVSSFGNFSEICRGLSPMLRTYTQLSKELQEALRTNANVERIERLKLAISILTENLNPLSYGVTLAVVVPGPQVYNVRVPMIEIDGQVHRLALIDSSDYFAEEKRFETRERETQVRVTFKQLGICQFAQPQSGALYSAELQAAVDSLFLGR